MDFIEEIWCLFCNHNFFDLNDNDGKYICPKCGNELNFHVQTCRYIIPK